MTVAELIEYAKRRLAAGVPRTIPWDDEDLEIASAIPSASHELASEVMRDGRRGWLQQQYSITLDGLGVGALLGVNGSVTSQPNEILIESIPLYGSVLDASGVTQVHIANYMDFVSPQPVHFGYYTLRDKKIYTRLAGSQARNAAEVVSAAGPLTVLASYAPANVSDWPKALEDDLVSKVVTIVTRKVEDRDAKAR